MAPIDRRVRLWAWIVQRQGFFLRVIERGLEILFLVFVQIQHRGDAIQPGGREPAHRNVRPFGAATSLLPLGEDQRGR